ncbi:MAG: oligoendopeptidase F [Desulfobacteraceae bacterium]|jgi:oligoendopeptidase F
MAQKTIPERKNIPEIHRWDLSPMFSSDEEWNSLYSEIEKKLPVYETYRGRLGESGPVLAEALGFILETGRSIEKLYVYTHLRNDEDKSNQQYLGMYQRAITLYTQAAELASFFTPEIQKIDDDRIKTFLEDDNLKEYGFYLEKILRYKPHTHDEKIEQILAMSQDFAQGMSQAFGQLDNVDLKFGNITDETGESIELSHGNFSTFLINPDREIRKKVFHQYYSEYKDHENTIATTLSYSNKKNIFYSRVRNFESARSAALFSDDVPKEVYDNLVSTVHDNLDPLFDYFRFRKETLGLDELHFYDTYVPIVPDIKFSMPYEEAVEVCVKALAPLGKEYTDTLKNGLLNGWVDRYENKGKRSGAYSSGCYDSLPYILMNYEDKNINSLYTLTHEAGHSMHSYLSIKNQPYVDYEYTIFVAEVASTFNETLLSGYLLDLYKDDPAMKAYILNREVDNFRATLYRQTMFAEFEKVSHAILEQNQPLTLETIKGEYRKLLDDYFGDTMVIDPELELECLRIPHFYSAFYVYKYATGISAAIALADMVVKGGEEARDSYLNFLKLGGSKFPLDELLDAGVDMRTPEPVRQAIAHFEKRVGQLKEEIAKFKG